MTAALLIHLPGAIVVTMLISLLWLNRHNRNAKQFMEFLIAVDGFVVFRIAGVLVDDEEIVLWLTRIAIGFGALTAYMFLRFALNFPWTTNVPINRLRLLRIFSAVSIFVIMSPLSIKAVSSTEYGLALGDFGWGYIYYAVYFSFLYLVAVTILLRKIKDSTSLERQQIQFTIISVMGAAGFSIASTMILDLFFPAQSGSLVQTAGEMMAIALGGIGVTYVIVQHRLFEIRYLLSRGLAYILSGLTLLAITFSIPTFLIFRVIDPRENVVALQATIIGIALLSGIIFWPIKRLFDSLTNRIFYSHSYTTRQTLDDLSEVLVSHIELDVLLRKVIRIFYDSLHCSRGTIVAILDNAAIDSGSHNLGFTLSDEVVELILKPKDDLLIVYEVEEKQLRDYMQDNQIEVIKRIYTKDGVVGVVMLGPKENGNVYNPQDLELLNITGKNLSVALEHALSYRQINNYNARLMVEVKKATNKLKRTNERLHELDSAKDEFISMSSHQLRTPLTAIKSYLSLYKEGKMGRVDPKQKEALAKSYSSTERMVTLIDELLDVSKISTGNFRIEPERILVRSILTSERDHLDRIAHEKNVTINLDIIKKELPVYADKNRLREVVMNFIDNAIHYTPQGESIDIKLTKKRGKLEFTVTDSGIGIPKEEQNKLFTKFFRASNAKSYRPDGTGLGLFIAQRVIKEHDGTIIFSSKEGRGSIFGFTLPIVD